MNGDLDSEEEEDEEEEDEDEGQGNCGQPLPSSSVVARHLRVIRLHRVIWRLCFRRGFDGCQRREEEEGR